MRKAVAGIALALALAPAAVSAQSGTVSATATILGTMTVTNVADLDFGSIPPGAGQTLTPGAAAPAGATMGVLQIDHFSNFTASSVITGMTGPGGALAATFSCGYSTTPNGALTGGTFACATPAASPATVAGAATTTYLQVGGTIAGAATTGLAAGLYTGSLVFTFAATL